MRKYQMDPAPQSAPDFQKRKVAKSGEQECDLLELANFRGLFDLCMAIEYCGYSVAQGERKLSTALRTGEPVVEVNYVKRAEVERAFTAFVSTRQALPVPRSHEHDLLAAIKAFLDVPTTRSFGWRCKDWLKSQYTYPVPPELIIQLNGCRHMVRSFCVAGFTEASDRAEAAIQARMPRHIAVTADSAIPVITDILRVVLPLSGDGFRSITEEELEPIAQAAYEAFMQKIGPAAAPK